MSNDVVVIGGGPAGLQAALTVARVGREVVVLDSGEYRNEAAAHMHNYAGADGTPPGEHRARARQDLARYPSVTLLEREATSVRADGDGFIVAAGEDVRAAAVVLATGVRDELPDVPGLAELWGSEVAHCPFCHGYELKDRVVAVHGTGPSVQHVPLLMARLARRVVVLTDGGELDEQTARALAGRGVDVVPERVERMERTVRGAAVRLADGVELEVGGMFVSPGLVQRAPFAAQLGLEVLPSGCVAVDDMQRTSLAGVLAAGDMAHRRTLPMPMAAVLAAAASGQVAGAAAVAALLHR